MNTQKQHGRLAAGRVVGWVAAIVLLSLTLMAFAAVRTFEASLEPEMNKRTALIAATVREEIERAIDFGVPLEAIGGASEYLDELLKEFPELEKIMLRSNSGRLIASSSRGDSTGTDAPNEINTSPNTVTLSILRRNTIVGELTIEADPRFVRSRLQEVMLDIIVVGLVAILLAFEIVLLVSANMLGKPLDRIFTLMDEQAAASFRHVLPARDAGELRRVARRLSDRALHVARLRGAQDKLSALPQAYFVDIRLPVFIFSTATEISGAFLPLYARDAGGPDWLTSEMAATAPLIAYLVAMALMAPFGGAIARRFSPQRLFLSAIPITALTMVGVGLGQNALVIAFWHGFMAIVYALATISCQEYAIKTAPRDELTQAIGGFLFVIIGGAFCGSALGGVLADRIGASGTFFFGAGLAVLSGLIGARVISGHVSLDQEVTTTQSDKSIWTVLTNRRFFALTLGVSVPINIGMSVFIWYLTPVVLEGQGVGVADIGRIVMLYYLAQLLLGPTVARFADGKVGQVPFLIFGIFISGVAISSLYFLSGIMPMIIVVTLFGLGYAMCDATQYAQAIQIGEQTCGAGGGERALGALRLIERLAAIIGLIASVILIPRLGYLTIIGGIGVLMLCGTLIMLGGGNSHRKTPEHVSE
ncbi:MFS transporter [Ruegeria arenilitoris]|uniref:MFS transporter n=1 Tax=Ruegeria arenilitoris TaxID=1173585 RepID=UPI0014810278|nr:MFS transporter [Ruegeria arenilitoris]